MKRVTFGISVITALAVPLALAAEWATDREAAREAIAAGEAAFPNTVVPDAIIPLGQPVPGQSLETPAQAVAAEMRIYPSF